MPHKHVTTPAQLGDVEGHALTITVVRQSKMDLLRKIEKLVECRESDQLRELPMVELERLGQLFPLDGAKVMKFGLQHDNSARHVLSKASAFCQYASDRSFCARYFSSSFSEYFPYAYTISMAIA